MAKLYTNKRTFVGTDVKFVDTARFEQSRFFKGTVNEARSEGFKRILTSNVLGSEKIKSLFINLCFKSKINMNKTNSFGVTPEQMEDFEASFAMFDRDGDGRITKDELRTAMRNLGQNPTEHELDEMFMEIDENGNGTVEYDEYMRMMAKRIHEVDEEEELRRSFKIFDKDGDGFISLRELKWVMTNMGERMSDEEVKVMLQQADTNGDGKIDYDEFVRMITQPK